MVFDPIFLGRNVFWYAGQLILSKIIKIVATSCQILRPNAPNSILAGASP